ncbi:MAG TPA: type II toxin-antitoxin system MqsA family antitoxin [Chloroflexi bacterium]|nr:type II toxin-antitoxin system MqsA family antitoxin [Chloroflexota bacterium]
MKCVNCFSEEPQIGVASLTYEREGSAIRVEVEGVPAEICPNCGEIYLSEAVAQQIYDLVTPLLETGEEMMETSLLPPPTVVIHFPPLEPAQLKEAAAIA